MTIKGYFILFFYSILSGKKRKPAWTDRILWRIKPKPLPSEEDDEKASTSTDEEQDEYPVLVTQDKYTSDMSYGVSDHKPVIATFSLEVRADALHRPLLFQTFFKNIFFSLIFPAAEKSLWHTTGARVSCGHMERRPGCTFDLLCPGGLYVFYVGLDRPVQGTRTHVKTTKINK